MNSAALKTFVRERARKCRRACSDHLWHAHAAAPKSRSQVPAGDHSRHAPRRSVRAHPPRHTDRRNSAGRGIPIPLSPTARARPDNFARRRSVRFLCGSCPDLCREKRRPRCLAIAAPVLRSRPGRKFARLGTHLAISRTRRAFAPMHWIGEKHVRCTAAAGYQQFERGGTLEIPDATLDQHAERVGQLCGLNVSTPAIGVAAEQMQGRAQCLKQRSPDTPRARE